MPKYHFEYQRDGGPLACNCWMRHDHDADEPGAFIALFTELDRALTDHDVGHSIWYLDWRKRVAATLGCDEGELDSGREPSDASVAVDRGPKR